MRTKPKGRIQCLRSFNSTQRRRPTGLSGTVPRAWTTPSVRGTAAIFIARKGKQSRGDGEPTTPPCSVLSPTRTKKGLSEHYSLRRGPPCASPRPLTQKLLGRTQEAHHQRPWTARPSHLAPAYLKHRPSCH